MRSRALVLGVQAAILAAFLAAWEYLPQIGGLAERTHFLDPFFISSPSRILSRLIDLTTGRNDSVLIWRYLGRTIYASVCGTVFGMVAGALAGLVLSNSPFMARVFRPYVIALNAVPRVALIPVVVILFGPTTRAGIVVSIMVTFFVAFFSAFEGGRSVAPELLHNAQLLGASRVTEMTQIRMRFVMAWTLSVLPLGATFSLISVITTEILTGGQGLGRLIAVATATVDASLTFSVVVVASLLGLLTVGLAQLFEQRILHWWGKG